MRRRERRGGGGREGCTLPSSGASRAFKHGGDGSGVGETRQAASQAGQAEGSRRRPAKARRKATVVGTARRAGLGPVASGVASTARPVRFEEGAGRESRDTVRFPTRATGSPVLVTTRRGDQAQEAEAQGTLEVGPARPRWLGSSRFLNGVGGLGHALSGGTSEERAGACLSGSHTGFRGEGVVMAKG